LPARAGKCCTPAILRPRPEDWPPAAISHNHPTAADFRFAEERHTGVFACRHVWMDAKPIVFVSHDEDGDWQFLCGNDHGEVAANGYLLVCLEHIVSRDPSVNELATMCTAHVARRESACAPWSIEDETPGHIRKVIDRHGWWVGLVHSDGDAPAFAYTIGLYEKYGHPEIILFGLAPESMHTILNHCGAMIRSGKRFPVGRRSRRCGMVTTSGSASSQPRRVMTRISVTGAVTTPIRDFRSCSCSGRISSTGFPEDAEAADFLVKRQPLLA